MRLLPLEQIDETFLRSLGPRAEDLAFEPELKATLADHAAGNSRVLMNLADKRLTAADRDLPRLDEKLFFDVFGQVSKPKPPNKKC